MALDSPAVEPSIQAGSCVSGAQSSSRPSMLDVPGPVDRVLVGNQRARDPLVRAEVELDLGGFLGLPVGAPLELADDGPDFLRLEIGDRESPA